MKKLLLTLLAGFALSLASQAQPVVDLVNHTNCPLLVDLQSFSFCDPTGNMTYFVAPGATVTAVAPPGSEWILADFQEAGCALPGIPLEAPAVGCTFCSFGAFPPVNSGPSCSCGIITGEWHPCIPAIFFF